MLAAPNIGPVRPPHVVLITIYWNLAWPVRLPLPIIPGVNATAHRFGGFGLKLNGAVGRRAPSGMPLGARLWLTGDHERYPFTARRW